MLAHSTYLVTERRPPLSSPGRAGRRQSLLLAHATGLLAHASGLTALNVKVRVTPENKIMSVIFGFNIPYRGVVFWK